MTDTENYQREHPKATGFDAEAFHLGWEAGATWAYGTPYTGDKEENPSNPPNHNRITDSARSRHAIRSAELIYEIKRSWWVRAINDGTMKQINLHNYYMLGKALDPLFMVREDSLINDSGFDAIAACVALKEVTREDSAFLPGTRRAASALLAELVEQFGDGIQDEHPLPVFWRKGSASTLEDGAEKIRRSVTAFDTVFKLEAPRMTIFSAERNGLYDMEGLIDHADQHLPESASKRLPPQAKEDLRGAGRCLAFNIPTASAFHAWRALEIVFGAYYASMTGNTFTDAGIQRNWGKYIEALDKAGADKEITRNLDHIRSEYRNPIMHPDENVTADKAFSLLGIAYSAITQVMQAIELQPHAKKALG